MAWLGDDAEWLMFRFLIRVKVQNCEVGKENNMRALMARSKRRWRLLVIFPDMERSGVTGVGAVCVVRHSASWNSFWNRFGIVLE